MGEKRVKREKSRKTRKEEMTERKSIENSSLITSHTHTHTIISKGVPGYKG